MEEYKRQRNLRDIIIPITQISTIIIGLIISFYGLKYFSIVFETFTILLGIGIYGLQIAEIIGIAFLIKEYSHEYEKYVNFLYTIFILELVLLISLIPIIQNILSFNIFLLSAFFPSFVFVGILSASVLKFKRWFFLSFIGFIIDGVNFSFDISLLRSNILLEIVILTVGSSLFFMGLFKKMSSKIKGRSRIKKRRGSLPGF
jgi:hypothetical protein